MKFAIGAKSHSIIVMYKENLPLSLLNKHLPRLELDNPVFFEDDGSLFSNQVDLIKSAVVFLPKSKAFIDMTLALVSGKVALGGTIVLVGANDAGIRSAKDLYEKNIGPVEQKIVGNHSALYVGKNQRLGANKTWRDFLSFSPISHMLPGKPDSSVAIEIANLPGVFSAGELDEGTKLLLDAIPYDKNSVLDVGCGAGVIGAIYRKRNPQNTVVMSDKSILAIHATEETLKKNGLGPDKETQVVSSNVFDSVEGKFDLILSNPPFHSGVTTDYSFIENFAQNARTHLKPNGEVFIVANAFLPYKEILERHIGSAEVVIETKKFKVYKCSAKTTI